MDISTLTGRVRRILLSPQSEWPAIAGEVSSVKRIYVPHVLVLAALPALAGFISNSLIGHAAFGIHVRVPILSGLIGMLIGYALSLVLVYVLALIVSALAPHFGGHKNPLQALKTVACAWTAAWLAGVAVIVPWLGWLIALAGGVYSIYLLYLGLPHTMQCAKEKAGLYTLVSVVIAAVLSWILALLVGGIVGMGMLGSASISSQSGANVTYAKDSRLGAIMELSKRVQAAGEAAHKAEGADKGSSAKAEAVRDVYAAMLTGKADGKVVQSMPSGKLKSFLPETMGDWKRTKLSAKREGGMGMQITTARAWYTRSKGGNKVIVSLMDSPALSGLRQWAGAFGSEMESQTDHGYEKKYTSQGQRIHEKWNERSQSGTYSSSFGESYQVEVKGSAKSMDELKQIAAQLDLDAVVRAGKG